MEQKTSKWKSIWKILFHSKQKIGQISIPSNGLDETYLFDFKNWSSQYNGNVSFIQNNPNNPAVAVTPNTFNGGDAIDANIPVIFGTGTEIRQDAIFKKLKVKPVDVLNELEVMPTPFTLILLDEKIGILLDKSKLIVQHYSKREVEALIERLENRKKYNENKLFFDKYQNTTDEKIDTLLGKYDLVMKTSDIFIPEFPDEAIKTMTQYTEKMKLICDKKPVFYVIAEPVHFKKAYEKRDPILLVQSPFGFYWQILGAWDAEMILLSEL